MIKSNVCEICGKSFKRLASHIVTHGFTIKQYYDEYYKKPDEGICRVCGKETKFVRNGYNLCCCQAHATLYRQQQSGHHLKIEKFEKDNNCTSCATLRNIYGQGWYKANVIKDYITASFDTHMFFVKNEDIHLIEEYCKKRNNASRKEQELQKFVKNLCGNVKTNDKKTIYPKELDIYIPDLKLAIEYNGIWYHSVEHGAPKDHILNKSIICRNKGIRLIHIYEFEDFEEQKMLLYHLIVNNNDLYNKHDFNKNNLIDSIPKPYKVKLYDRYTIYTAGKLFYKGD